MFRRGIAVVRPSYEDEPFPKLVREFGWPYQLCWTRRFVVLEDRTVRGVLQLVLSLGEKRGKERQKDNNQETKGAVSHMENIRHCMQLNSRRLNLGMGLMSDGKFVQVAFADGEAKLKEFKLITKRRGKGGSEDAHRK